MIEDQLNKENIKGQCKRGIVIKSLKKNIL